MVVYKKVDGWLKRKAEEMWQENKVIEEGELESKCQRSINYLSVSVL